MANDYLSGSQFGQVAGTLLGRKRSANKRQVRNAILANILFSTFGNLQKRQATELNDAINELKDDYKLASTGRAAVFNSDLNKKNRELVNLYNQDEEKAIQSLAKELYNEDDIITSRGFNYSMRGKIIDEEAKAIDEQFYQSKLKLAEEKLKEMKDNPLLNSSSFVEYNQVYHNEYKSALKTIKDDPTKKSLLKAAADRIFPNLFSSERADLDNVLSNASEETTNLREQQEAREVFEGSKKTMSNDEAAAYVQENFVQNESISDETSNKVLEKIYSNKSSLGYSENDLIALALTEKVLNPENLNAVQKEILKATELHDTGYLQRFGSIPTPENKVEYLKYMDSKTDYLDINVYKLDPESSQLRRIIKGLGNAKPDTDEYRYYQKRLKDLTEDKDFTRLLTLTLSEVMDPTKRLVIDEEIKLEKDKENPRYIDIATYFQYKLSEGKDLIDFYRNNP